MSGHHTSIKNTYKRREFFKQVLGVVGASAIVSTNDSCSYEEEYKHITGGLITPSYHTGHLLRTPEDIPAPTSIIETNVLIAGGGVAGLSAMRWLNRHNIKDVMMVELESDLGGNSTYGENGVSRYPWAAHYLPIPDNVNTELIDFLKEAGVVTKFDDKGLPFYNELYTCHDPESRLYINSLWQKGLVPAYGLSNEDNNQIGRFFEYVEKLKHEKGEDGKYHFSLPVDRSSGSRKYKELDKISFATFLKNEGYTSSYLLWYLEYCTKDDYGSLPEHVSAWAGLNYFAARRGVAANVSDSSILTWPEGNGFLKDELLKGREGVFQKNTLVYDVGMDGDMVSVKCYDASKKVSVNIKANKVLLSTPQYVNKRLLKNRAVIDMEYAPWVIANITYDKLPSGVGMSLCWDNVIFDKPSVGYVYANHQEVNRSTQGVITYYLPIVSESTNNARRQVFKNDYSYWKKYIIDELEYAHPNMSKDMKNIDIRVLGHGMIRPSVGYIWNEQRKGMMNSIDNKIFFAHSDLGGISVFEEAFYQGIEAAKKMIN